MQLKAHEKPECARLQMPRSTEAGEPRGALGMYFLGLSRYSYRVFSSQITAFSLLAVEYEYPLAVPEVRPKRPPRQGPCRVSRCHCSTEPGHG